MNNYLKFTCTVVLLFIMAAWAGSECNEEQCHAVEPIPYP